MRGRYGSSTHYPGEFIRDILADAPDDPVFPSEDETAARKKTPPAQ
jgi:hypothetical protein